MAWEMSRDYRLRWMDFDRYGRLLPSSVLDIFQDIATLQANDMGIGRDDLMKEGVFWAVVRMKYEILQEPDHEDVVIARTWPHSPSRYSFLRDYSLTDTDGNILVKATAEWVLIDAEKRTLASMKDKINIEPVYVEDRSFEKKPRKIKALPLEGLEPIAVITPTYSDIDLNGHVNNARYARYAIDAIDPDEHGALRTFQIDYRIEAHKGEPLRIFAEKDEDTITVMGINDNGDISFVCALEVR